MTSYFAGIVDFVGRHPHYAFTAIFILALSEALPVVGTVVPGSTLIIGICALATGAHVNPWPLLGAAILGAIFGDGLSFWLGRCWVIRVISDVYQALPVYPQLQTYRCVALNDANGMDRLRSRPPRHSECAWGASQEKERPSCLARPAFTR